MNKQAFKQRMQALKSYRESNPGKGYWDWKVQSFEDGGEVGDPDDEFIQAVNTKLGRTPDGRPKEQGLKPVIDLEDAANVTPIGDVLSAKDAYNAARNNDWLGVGLATATMIPFVPRAISTVRRSTPTVKNYRNSLSNALDKAVK